MEGTALIGLDTNVLLRYVLEDDRAQADLVESWLVRRSSRDPGYVSVLVLCEFAWILAKAYRHSREEIAEAVADILEMPALQVERFEAVQQALEQYRISRAGFSDCCVAAIAAAAGCDYTLTFDQHASKLPGMRLLSNA